MSNKATRIDLFNFSSRQMRAFHMAWFAFFLCFFAWFGVAPLMPIIREDLGLTKEQVGNTIVASVAATIFARFLVGWMCDRFGPRLSYTLLLLTCSLPVMGIGLSNSYESFLLFRLAIGAIGASFVITQYHTSVMFASNCVGTANATAAGWGNLGGGVTQMIMPLIFAAFIALGHSDSVSWRLSMVVAGILCLITGVFYYLLTTDFPEGNKKDLKNDLKFSKNQEGASFLDVVSDKRVWILFLTYAACFGIEITINNIAALYFTDYFDLGLKTAGLVAGTFGLMNIFARGLGGLIGDKIGLRYGLKGRVRWLFVAVVGEGLFLCLFSQMTVLPFAIAGMVLFSLFVQMAEGATYSVVPFINKKALGFVTGVVAAGGNIGAVSAGMLFRSPDMPWPKALLIVGLVILCVSSSVLLVRFSQADEEAAKNEIESAIKKKEADGFIDDRRPIFEFIKDIVAIDYLRFFLGGALAIKGIFFILNFAVIESQVLVIGQWQNIISWYVIFAHVVGGICLFLGLATRFSVLINLPVLIGAVFFIHWEQGLFANEKGLEFSIFVLFTLIVLFFNNGNLKLDNLIASKNQS